jgi:pyroglutamyl-peptidase
MKTILVTSFEPFDARGQNQSFEIAKKLKHIDHLSLPVVFNEAFQGLQQYLKTHQVDMIISLGEAPVTSIQLEYLALNRMHARIPDNKGKQPLHQHIIEHGQEVYPSSLPLANIERHLQSLSLRYSVSYHAGTYVCNDLFYRLMHAPLSMPRGFIHVPSDANFTLESIKAVQSIIDMLNSKE